MCEDMLDRASFKSLKSLATLASKVKDAEVMSTKKDPGKSNFSLNGNNHDDKTEEIEFAAIKTLDLG